MKFIMTIELGRAIQSADDVAAVLERMKNHMQRVAETTRPASLHVNESGCIVDHIGHTAAKWRIE